MVNPQSSYYIFCNNLFNKNDVIFYFILNTKTDHIRQSEMLRIRLILQDLQVHTDQYLQVCIIVIKSIYLLFKWYFKYILLQVIICINHFMYFQSMAETSGEVLMHITSHCRVGKECQWQNMRKSWSRSSNPGVDFDMLTIKCQTITTNW